MAYFDDACPCGENEDIPHFEHGTPDSDEDRPDSHDWIPDCGEDVPAATDSEEVRDPTEEEVDELVAMDEYFERAARCGMEDGELPFEGAGEWYGNALPWLSIYGSWDRLSRPARALVWTEPHPSALGDGWHICEHFLDPLVKLLKEVDDRCDADRMLREWTDWAPEDHLDEIGWDDDLNGMLGLGYEHVEPLAWLTEPRDGRFLGAEAFVAGLHRALDFLDVEHLPTIRADLEACVTELADYVRALGGDDPFPVLERHNKTHFRHALGSLSGTHPHPYFLNYLRDETSTETIRDWGALFCYGYLVLPAIGRLTQMSANLKRRWPVKRQVSGVASVDDFLRALDSIEAEIRDTPDVVFVEMSLTRGCIGGGRAAFDRTGRYEMLGTSRSIHAHWDDLCFDIGGSEFPFVWSPKRSAVYEPLSKGGRESFPKDAVCASIPKDLTEEPEPVEFAVWYYVDSSRNPVPQNVRDEYPAHEDDLDDSYTAAMFYKVEMDRAFNIMRSVKSAWSLAPEAVIREFGELSRLPTGPVLPAGEGDDFGLWWPAVLLYLALQEVDVVLSACGGLYIPWDSIFDDLPEGGDHNARIEAFDPTTVTVSLNPPGLLAATRCALRAFRRVAEDSMKKSSTVTAGSGVNFQGTAPLKAAEKRDGSSEHAHTMKREGRLWHIIFGEERGVVNNSRGAEHVAQLLASAGKSITCTLLHGSTEGTINAHQPTINKDDAKAQLEQLRKAMNDLEEQHKNNPSMFTTEDAANLEQVKAQIRTHANTLQRKERAPGARVAVARAIERFKSACRETTLKGFANHLDDKLDTGAELVYKGPHEWKIQK